MPITSYRFTTSDTTGSMTSNSERADVDKRLIDERPVESGHTSDGIEVIDVDALPSADERQPADVEAK